MNDESLQRTLIILNDPPYGTERSYNGMRLANALSEGEDIEVRVFLMGDGVACAKRGQNPTSVSYNLEQMIQVASGQGAIVDA